MSILDTIMYNNYIFLDNKLKNLPKRDKNELLDKNIMSLQKIDSEISELKLKKKSINNLLIKKKYNRNKLKKIINQIENKRNYICTIC